MEHRLPQQLPHWQLGPIATIPNLVPLFPSIIYHVTNHHKRDGASTRAKDSNVDDTLEEILSEHLWKLCTSKKNGHSSPMSMKILATPEHMFNRFLVTHVAQALTTMNSPDASPMVVKEPMV